MAMAAVVPFQQSQQLALLSKARQALEQARSIPEVKDIRDKAAAIQDYLKRAGESLEIQNAAAEVKLRAERKIGALIPEVFPRGGDRRSNSTGGSLKLEDFDLNWNFSARSQKLSDIPDADFDAHIESFNSAGKELTTASVLRLAKGEPKPVRDLSLGDCLEQLRAYVEKMWRAWPADERDALGHQLKCLSKEVLDGTLVTECGDDDC
jgi:hypothetical protein